MNWPAPAKLNLFLHITSRRADGYHELQTVFQFLDYGDNLQFEVIPENQLSLQSSLSGVADEDNLIIRAARLLKQHTGAQQGVNIILDKKLPVGGGLGGGSSNAATTLVALNQLWQCGLNDTELAQLGLQLGADVPIFIKGQAAWAEGVGEEMTPINPVESWFAVINPNCQVSTAEIFSAPELTRDCEPITIPRFLSGEGGNVCEAVVKKRYSPVNQALEWLDQYGSAKMTGTGACIFTDFATEHEAQVVIDALPSKWQGFVAKGCNLSPLKALMTQKVNAK